MRSMCPKKGTRALRFFEVVTSTGSDGVGAVLVGEECYESYENFEFVGGSGCGGIGG